MNEIKNNEVRLKIIQQSLNENKDNLRNIVKEMTSSSTSDLRNRLFLDFVNASKKVQYEEDKLEEFKMNHPEMFI